MADLSANHSLRIPTAIGSLAADLYWNPRSSERRIAILCHGLLNNRHSKVIRLFNEYLLSRTQWSTCLMDFRGNGDSDGETNYGNYEEEAQDLQAIAEYLSSEFGPVNAVIGHSKAASVVLIFMRNLLKTISHPLLTTLSTVMMLSGRLNMSESESISRRFTAEQLEQLNQTGRFIWRQYRTADGAERPYIITKESLDRRHSTDMHAVCREIVNYYSLTSNSESSRVMSIIILHGSADTTVPVEDAREYFGLFNRECCSAQNVPIRCQLIELSGVDHFYTGVTVDRLWKELPNLTCA